MSKKRKFHTRSFVTFLILFNFAIMAVTGLILYVTPPGRIARWTGWVFWGMSKDQLEGIHTVSSIVFFVVSIYHIILNRRAIWSYLKIRHKRLKQQWIKHGNELVLAFILSVLIFIGSYVPFSPFVELIDFGDKLKKSWVDKSAEAPVPEAEKLSLKEFCHRVLKMDVQEAIAILKAQSIEVENENQQLRDIARKNGLSPADIYKKIRSKRH